jgi:hypothetical protein
MIEDQRVSFHNILQPSLLLKYDASSFKASENREFKIDQKGISAAR